VPADWDSAKTAVADRSRRLLDEDGPGSVAFYTSGQLFAEAYYTLATIAPAGIGTNY
jgi:anaerobic selenocysteine-containing dehydrogenase